VLTKNSTREINEKNNNLFANSKKKANGKEIWHKLRKVIGLQYL
jgi:phage terminase large subunit-like protein